MSLTIRPIHDYVWVRPDKQPDRSPGGIHIPQAVRDKLKAVRGTVLAVGPGLNKRYRTEVDHIPMEVEVGQSVVYPDYVGKEIEIDGEKITLINECDIMGIVMVTLEPGKKSAKKS